MKITILHGLFMHGLVMQPLSYRLKSLGYETQIVSYNSIIIDEEKLFQSIDSSLDHTQNNMLIGHSLGGVAIKNYLTSRSPSHSLISHVVALGSPLNGASIVCRIQALGLGSILGNSPQFGLKKHDDEWHFPQKLGSIAGTIPIGMRPLLLMDNGTLSDGTVTVEETKIKGMTDHLTTRASHTSLIYNRYLPTQIDHFVRQNHFQHTH